MPLTANNSDPDSLPSSMAAKRIIGAENWERFIQSLVEESRTWSAYEVCVNDRARAAKIKRQYLPNQYESGNLEQRCYLFLDNCSFSAPQQAQQGGLNGELARLLELHKKDPAQALKQAQGNPIVYNKFLKQTNA